METKTFVIIGAGAMGSAAAYHLSRRGEPVVLIEQFALGHNRGSSHGWRPDHAALVCRPAVRPFNAGSLRAWKDLEADAGETVFIRTGGVSFCPHGVDYVDRVVANLKELEVSCWQGSGRAWNERHPVFGLPRPTTWYSSPMPACLPRSRASGLQMELAKTHGGDPQVLDQTPVQRIDLSGPHPIVVTESAKFVADRLIVTAGPWVDRLLPRLAVPLQVTRQQVLYFRPTD